MRDEAEFIAVLRMLVRRATWFDQWRAWRIKGHWLNAARRELLVNDSQASGETRLRTLRGEV